MFFSAVSSLSYDEQSAKCHSESDASCVSGECLGYILSLMPYVITAGRSPLRARGAQNFAHDEYFLAFSGMRMFALTGKNWILTCVVVILSIVPIPINLVSAEYVPWPE